MLTLALLVAGVGGVNAKETSIYTVDYSTQTAFNFWNGSPTDVSVSVTDGQLVINNTKEQDQMYSLQLHIGSGITTKAGLDYRVKIDYKTTKAGSVWVGLGNWGNRDTNYDVSLTVSEEFQTLTLNFNDYKWDATDNFIMWQSGKLVGTIYIKKVEVIEIAPDDPLELPKQYLNEKIGQAKMMNGYAYTETSFSNLASEITTAEAALAAEDATEESLTAAKDNLQTKIDALTLKENYSNLTQDMFKHWDSATDPTSGSSTGCSYDLLKSTGQPYGDGNVGYLNYADLSNYDKLIIIANAGTPRVLLNRVVDNGAYKSTETESKMIEMPKNGEWTDRYYTKDDVVFVYNLAQITSDKGFAHLHAIKGANYGNVTVSGMYLYKSPDPLASFKEALTDKINNGKLQNALGKTESSFAALTTAISNAQTALTASDATQESLENAGKAIDSAIAGLKLAAGFAKVTKNMFMIWDGDGAEAKATGVSPAGAYNIGVAGAGVPYGYGSGNVYWNHYADLTPYEKLYACGSKGVRARYLFNRPMDTSNPSGEGTSAFIQKYVDVNESGVAELTLSEVSTEFVHLNTFKAPDGGTFTDFLVYAAKTNVAVGAAGYTTFSSIMNVDLTGVTGYAAKYDGSKIVLTEITAAPAGEGIIVKAAEGNYSLTNIESAAAIDNDLLVSDGSVKGDGSTIFALANGAKGIGFYLVKNENQVPVGKAYLKIPAGGARSFIGFGSETTGISEVATKVAADSKYYDLQGRTVAQPAKGLYIVNGKKMLVK